MKLKIALLDDYHNRARHFADWSSANFAQFTFFAEHHSSEEALVADLREFDAIGVMRERTPLTKSIICLLYTSPSPRDRQKSRMPSSA